MRVLNESCHKKINLIHVSTAAARSLYYYVHWTGHFVCREDFCIDRADFASYLALYTVSGEGRLVYGGREYRLRPGSTVLIDCRKHHTYAPVTDGWEFKYVHFDGAQSEALYDRILTVCDGCVAQHAAEVERYIDRLMDAVRLSEAEEQSSALLYRLLMRLLGAQGERQGAAAEVLNTAEIMTYIAENYEKPLTVDHLAATVHMSRTHFSTEFKRLTGYTPHGYLTSFRLTSARRLLISTEHTVSEIAERCGFRDASTFIRAFRHHEGIPPHAYRKSRR